MTSHSFIIIYLSAHARVCEFSRVRRCRHRSEYTFKTYDDPRTHSSIILLFLFLPFTIENEKEVHHVHNINA